MHRVICPNCKHKYAPDCSKWCPTTWRIKLNKIEEIRRNRIRAMYKEIRVELNKIDKIAQRSGEVSNQRDTKEESNDS